MQGRTLAGNQLALLDTESTHFSRRALIVGLSRTEKWDDLQVFSRAQDNRLQGIVKFRNGGGDTQVFPPQAPAARAHDNGQQDTVQFRNGGTPQAPAAPKLQETAMIVQSPQAPAETPSMSSPSTGVAAPFVQDNTAEALRRRNDDPGWHQHVEQERLRRLEEEQGLEEYRQERNRTVELASEMRRQEEERGLEEHRQECKRAQNNRLRGTVQIRNGGDETSDSMDNALFCSKHKTGPLDVWYDCGACVQEANAEMPLQLRPPGWWLEQKRLRRLGS